VLLAGVLTGFAADKKIVFLAGNPSHPSGEHEHRAGCLLLQSCLESVPDVTSVVYSSGWPAEADAAFTNAAAVIVYCDGGGEDPRLRLVRPGSRRSAPRAGAGGCPGGGHL
jgi:hypothetical protein